MKRIICKKEYDTETATLVKKYTFGNFGDEDGYEDYYVWAGDHPDMSEKYSIHAKKVKRFNYEEDLKFISDVER